ncbi:proline--tRNA ligase [Burkholderia ambifaria AMMD]|uniref:Proline--tRNA ligase n=1 Tax=Burkholderia ambifaria (strain ATCC BAA-244 / DSM 16087 / CCUG 44356 / LMG 19182 / AMMD) TaxID=339670 RepID=SYP_BURCM|nr:proline--tRNA ligase [Burkholderia ambifaria]Q0BIH4.1 RecName: Full=Proline--tRNA ligase; AltName: Full=Prolyl-tRNA synthetase; Short=ProRS [Burkholderia ambifaria AMMD]ABI86049.1 prolyl-tRNA synthetase [Burkholderia ambifaria AMMD]AJY20514.1 proline--tRNA ligase [Burkholderia ambifaria AMMD]MBR7933645.1 proline--tRNA ligase [Burkholderia ambifaria]PEH66629.1 proline--tRNA ligase [Burkholderia ambifaria]QQC03604.1 proline--tRNA ligase [Burkholderia ambifaria]
MKASRFFIGTLKEAPADAEIVSHKLMVRAGMIRRVAGGIYNYLPVGLRSIRKVEAIVREEMNRAGAIELLMPAVQPAELWQESGRWEQYGPELLRFKDRKDNDFVIGPTHEEVVTDIARNQIKSYRQMPVNFYQIQTKFRDEIRPRFGVMRGREFLMKDAYSFDKDTAGLNESYRKMYDAYVRIFTRLGLEFRAVAADSGSIGGNFSHEFHVIADTGEDAIAYCPTSDFAANIEAAEALPLIAERAAPAEAMEKVATPGKAKCEAVAELLAIPLERTIKSIVLATENEGAEPTIWLIMLRGDHDLNEIKVSKLPGLKNHRFATEQEIVDWFGTPPGYLGPVGTKKPVKVIADRTVANMSDFVVGANEVDYHIAGVNWGRDLPEPEVADVRDVKKGDPSPDGKGTIDICRGIEVGHVFQLGTKYSDAMGATFLDESGKPQPMLMGCYGVGITRILGAAIEQNFDDKGIIWPESIAPFEVVLCPMGYDRSDMVREAADKLYAELAAAGIDVILDDRGERPGVMFADWELIGVPHRLVIGERGLKEGKIEYQGRRDAEATLLPADEAAATVTEKIRAALAH